MSDPAAAIPLQNPAVTDQNVAAIQVTVNGQPRLVEFCLPGHPLIARTEWVFTTLQTNVVLIAAPGASKRTTLTTFAVFLAGAASVDVDVRVGFATTALAAESTSGVTRIILNHRLTPGSGVVQGSGTGALAQSSANDPLRLTNSVPTGGKLVVLASYFQPEFA